MEKYIKKILRESLLREGVSDIMYHFTSSSGLRGILSTNKINLTPVFGTKADQEINNNKLYALSLTTSGNLNIGYGTRIANEDVVRLNLNGRVINQLSKTKRVDYWRRPKDPKDPMYSTTHKDDLLRVISGSDELEDRVISDKESIGPANKIISSIDLLLVGEHDTSELKDMADELGIPLYAYDNKKYFNHSIRDKAIEISKPKTIQEPRHERPTMNYEYEVILATILYKNDELKGPIFKKLTELGLDIDYLSRSVDEVIDDKINRALGYGENNFYVNDFTNSLNADIHNAKSKTSPVLRYILNQFGLDMKRNGCGTIKEYIHHKIYKGKKTDQQFKDEFLSETRRYLMSSFKENIEYRENSEYMDRDGNYHLNLYTYPPIKKFLDGMINKLWNYINGHVTNYNDDFRYMMFDLDTTILMEQIGFVQDKPIDDFSKEIEYDHEDLSTIIQGTIWDVSNFMRDKFFDIKDERENQWKVNN